MKRSVIETILGAVVLFVAGFFLVFSYNTANIKRVAGYEVSAAFAGTGGLTVGDDVVISGVRVGSVVDVALDRQTYLAVVRMSVASGIELPEDTVALISSEGLLGGRFLELQPGGAEELIPPGGRVQYTQAPQNLEQLLGQFIFSVSGNDAQTTQ